MKTKMILFTATLFSLSANADLANPTVSPSGIPSTMDQLTAIHHGAGNGGDGLELSNPTTPGGVTVSIPESIMAEYGILEVDGIAGAGQTNDVTYYHCESDASGQPIEYGCDKLKPIQAKLNTPLTTSPGVYAVNYSNSMEYAQVKANQKTTLSLRKLAVSTSSQLINFSVFLDLTNPSMQDLLLKMKWTFAKNYDVLPNCEFISSLVERTREDQRACSAFTSGDYHNLINQFIVFNGDGSYEAWIFNDYNNYSQDTFGNQGRVQITDPQAGQFVSVFPGVYGIVFTNPINDAQQSQYGVKVE